jgi:hypothetical protein
MRSLPVALALYAAAALLHHIHNAEFLGEYPGMPAWLTPAIVYAVWSGVTVAGVLGYILIRRGYRFTGLGVLAAYSLYGFGSLAHYTRAPASAHTAAMNLTIGLEVATAALLLIAVAAAALKFPRQPTKA